MRLQDEKVRFNVFKEIKFPNIDSTRDCFKIDVFDELTNDILHKM